MAPPCTIFPASALEDAVQLDQGRRRKVAATAAVAAPSVDGSRQGAPRIDLAACELLSMVQYDCQIERPQDRQETVKCWPVQRWFRRCADQKGTFMVETTAWEGRKEDNV
ncbi:Mitochondrial export protein Som1 [Microdochium nivale]|nr:Mitochondrial export protein Som1 [Microdochium nivale]